MLKKEIKKSILIRLNEATIKKIDSERKKLSLTRSSYIEQVLREFLK